MEDSERQVSSAPTPPVVLLAEPAAACAVRWGLGSLGLTAEEIRRPERPVGRRPESWPVGSAWPRVEWPPSGEGEPNLWLYPLPGATRLEAIKAAAMIAAVERSRGSSAPALVLYVDCRRPRGKPIRESNIRSVGWRLAELLRAMSETASSSPARKLPGIEDCRRAYLAVIAVLVHNVKNGIYLHRDDGNGGPLANDREFAMKLFDQLAADLAALGDTAGAELSRRSWEFVAPQGGRRAARSGQLPGLLESWREMDRIASAAREELERTIARDGTVPCPQE